MQKECTIKSLSQYISKVNSIKVHKEIALFQPKLVFRGLSDYTYSLTPSLGRHPSQFWVNTLQTVEHGLVQAAQQKFPTLFSDADYPAVRLAKLQHYGIPTRMMDVTENALVALYFACADHPETDGEVVAFCGSMKSVYDPMANAIADTCRLTDNNIVDVETYYYRVMCQPYSSRLLYPGWETEHKKLQKRFVNQLGRPMFIEGGDICERQKNQQGKFILFPSAIDKAGQYVLDDLVKLEKSDKFVVKNIIIPAESKDKIISQLERFGITKEFLFADDVDEVCCCVVDEYKKRYTS